MFLLIAVSCGDIPPAREKSIVVNSTGNAYQSTVLYACNPGYKTNASTTLVCQANGQWNGTSGPTCTGLFKTISPWDQQLTLCNFVYLYPMAF